mgnify:CR=1 FL=1
MPPAAPYRILNATVRWPRYATRGEVNYGAFDRFTLVHFLIGVGYGLLALELWVTAVLAIAWEVLEDFLKASVPMLFPHGTRDTLRNAAGDVAAVLTGWILTYWLLRA